MYYANNIEEYADFINRRRDTFCYSIILMIVFLGLLADGEFPFNAYVLIFMREATRGLASDFSDDAEIEKAGKDKLKLASAAWVMTFLVMALYDIYQSLTQAEPLNPLTWLLLGLIAVTLRMAGGVFEVLASYSFMWDWPRHQPR